ncbi:hypothetical protein GCM10023194_43050 [Planotetraspora phitsanulokensis]|uniref:Uncharacterized protein n=1 Tax=Planotetraspora phitsanulokensis TaxID=575192 RepID=A0A8J3U4N8_9ACTN|nr:hypothetical protein [Planotetraspora phitsanulokensis]GII37907.1 hypothetical protein Pph01_29100 [Planotetraspora phitsanulokensis]
MGEPEEEFAPGEGPAAKVSVSLRAGNIRAIKERVGARGFSAYVDAAVERQIERDLLEEALQANEADNGPVPQVFRDEAAELFRQVKSAPELQGDGGWHAHEAS